VIELASSAMPRRTNLTKVARFESVAGIACLFLLLAAVPVAPQLLEDRSDLERQLDRAVDSANAGRFAEAVELYQELGRSSDPAIAWAGVSGQVIVHRMRGDGDSARSITQRISSERPELAGLMMIWDGDTAMVEKDVERARRVPRAADVHGTQVVDSQPIGVTALRQLASLPREEGCPDRSRDRAELARRFPRLVDRDEAIGEALAFSHGCGRASAEADRTTPPRRRVLAQAALCSRSGRPSARRRARGRKAARRHAGPLRLGRGEGRRDAPDWP
jgi:hypothetical protein